jgi:molybdopterin biosynthesis enzyme MoaB
VNVTGPVGLTVGDVMVAVKVTASPRVDGFGDEMRVAELVVSCITWLKMAEVLRSLFTSPE